MDKVSIFGSQGQSVYDNMYSKPPQLGDDCNALLSVAVLFLVDLPSLEDIARDKGLAEVQSGIFHGQYDFKSCAWFPLPCGLNGPSAGIPDRLVGCWWHTPFYDGICDDYAAGKFTGTHVGKLRAKAYRQGQ